MYSIGTIVKFYLEITGFPNWENVYSNILAIFIDSKEKHTFHSLILGAVPNTGKNIVNKKNKYIKENTGYINSGKGEKQI